MLVCILHPNRSGRGTIGEGALKDNYKNTMRPYEKRNKNKKYLP